VAGRSRPFRDGQLTSARQDPVTRRRISYFPAESKLAIEKSVFHTSHFLRRMHVRRGYQVGPRLENAWAFSVDLVVIAMVFWVASGLWMWWELRVTRGWGTLCAAAGVALFGFFLMMI